MNRPHDPALLFAPVAPESQAEALALCWPELVATERLRQFDLACVGSVKSVLLGAWRAGRLVGVARAHVQPGRTATLAPPRLLAKELPEVAVALIRECVTFCRNCGCQALHSLLPHAQGEDARLLTQGGLKHMADLLLLMSLTEKVPREPPQLDVELHDVGQIGEQRLAAVVKRTYEGSLDCPPTEGIRSLEDVLAGYRASGPFAAERWLLASRDGKDLGCLILTEVHDSAQWELTYLGVVPEARGSGLGVQLVRHAQWMTRAAGRPRLVVAVDAENAPALRVYDACGFIQWNRQSVFWCAL